MLWSVNYHKSPMYQIWYINLKLQLDSHNWDLRCANCTVIMFVSFPVVNRALNQHRQHFQVNDAINRDNSFFANSPHSVFLTSLSSLLVLITPVLDRFPSPRQTCHPVSAFSNMLLHLFFILFITDGGTRSWCGWTTGQVDPLWLPPLFLHYILLFFSQWGKFD